MRRGRRAGGERGATEPGAASQWNKACASSETRGCLGVRAVSYEQGCCGGHQRAVPLGRGRGRAVSGRGAARPWRGAVGGGVSRTAARRSRPPLPGRAASRKRPPSFPTTRLISRILDCNKIYCRSWIYYRCDTDEAADNYLRQV